MFLLHEVIHYQVTGGCNEHCLRDGQAVNSGNAGFGAEPAGVEISYIILSPGNSVIAGPGSAALEANFEYGASWEDIRAHIVNQLRTDNSDPDLSVAFLPAG